MNSTSTPYAPEDCIVIPPGAIPIDVVNTCLSRVRATLRAVMVCGDGQEFELRHHDVIELVAGALAWVEMADKALNPEPAKPTEGAA